MQAQYKILKNLIKWLCLTALLAMLGFALSSPLAQHEFYSDEASTILVIEVEEASADAEPQLDGSSEIQLFKRQLQFSANLNPHHLFYSEFAPRLAFLYHMRPRSPPVLQTS